MSPSLSTAGNFSSVPILDYALLSTNKPQFISQLRHALVNVGFLYLSNSPVSNTIIDSVISNIPKLFTLPREEKERVRMTNSEHFLGYSRLGAEFTKGAVDYREQFDFATPHISRWKEGDPDYYRLWGPSQVWLDLIFNLLDVLPTCSSDTLLFADPRQWPEESLIPGFRSSFETYLSQVQSLSYEFASLIAEAFGLPKDGLSHFYDVDDLMQHRAKIVQYPVVEEGAAKNQGVGPHYDAGFLTFVESDRKLRFHSRD